MGGFQYLAGYGVANLIKKLKSTKNQTISKDLTNQMILILESCTVHDISDQKLIAAQTRGWFNCCKQRMPAIVYHCRTNFQSLYIFTTSTH